MCFALLKLSYNNPGDQTIEGGICGSGFFINEYSGITAHHLLNSNTINPNTGFRFSRLWLLNRDGTVLPVDNSMIRFIPEIDTSVITLERSVSASYIYNYSRSIIIDELPIIAYGHIANQMPVLTPRWERDELIITDCNLDAVCCDREGNIVEVKTMSVNSNDINMENVRGFQVSFQSCIGMSGGPVLKESVNELVGMLSFGLPADSIIKTSTFGVSINEILDHTL